MVATLDPQQALSRLQVAGILERRGEDWRTTAKWQRAFMRAESRVVDFHEAAGDLRLPVGYALTDILGNELPEDELTALTDALVPIEEREEREMEPDAEAGPEAAP